jgi:hypothetical protein
MNRGSLQSLQVIHWSYKWKKCHRAFGLSDALAVTSRQNVSHYCFLTKTLSVSTSRAPVDVSGPEEVPYA